MKPKLSTAQEIRERLIALCNYREHAYKAILANGKTVHNYSLKISCINKIRLHLDHFATCSDTANINLVHFLKSDIEEILPQSSNNPKVISYREKINKMITWCEEQFQAGQNKINLTN